MTIEITRDEISDEEMDAIVAEGRCEDCGHLMVQHYWDRDWGTQCAAIEDDCRCEA